MLSDSVVTGLLQFLAVSCCRCLIEASLPMSNLDLGVVKHAAEWIFMTGRPVADGLELLGSSIGLF